MSEDKVLLTPDDIKKRKEEKTKEENIKPRIANYGGMAKVEYESCGRYNIPGLLYWENYNTEHVSDLSLTGEEELLPAVVAILNELKHGDEDNKVDILDMTNEEFIETLIAIKANYDETGEPHKHRWMCKCQKDIPDDEKELSVSNIDLSTLQYTNIQEADEKLREYYKTQLEALSKEDYSEYLKSKYGQNIQKSIKEEVETISIKDPIKLVNPANGDVYEYAFPRMRHTIKGYQKAIDEFRWPIKKVEQRKARNEEEKAQRQKEMDDLLKQRAKQVAKYIRAFSLMKFNGKELSDEQKIEVYRKMPINLLYDLTNFQELMQFGLTDERELTCNLCKETDRRLLRRNFSPFEFLPFPDDSEDVSTSHKSSKPPRLNIFIG